MKPSDVFRERVKEVRSRREWSREKLADRLRAAGYPMTEGVIKKIETGTKKTIDVDEVFALSAALGVSPLYMLVPKDEETQVDVVPTLRRAPRHVREWIRGINPLDADWREPADWRIYATEIADVEMSEAFAQAREMRAQWLADAPARIADARERGDDERVAYLEYTVASGNVPLPLREHEVIKEES